MKTVAWMLGLVTILVCGAGPIAAQDSAGRFNDAAFIGYEGPQTWPTGAGAQVASDFAVPIFFGLPDRPYRVLGRVLDDRTGVGMVGRALSRLFSERDRQRDAANQAKFRGGDALVVTNDERIIKALGLTRDDVTRTALFFQHSDSVLLVVKFL